MSKSKNKFLLDPTQGRDACGIGFVANVKGEKSHKIVEMGIEMLIHLEHRGACGCDPLTGDGAGILIQIPHEFYLKNNNFSLPQKGEYGVGMIFLPSQNSDRKICEEIVNQVIQDEKQHLLGWRDVPIDPNECGELSRLAMPVIRQVFISKNKELPDEESFERKLYVIRKRIEQSVRESRLKTAQDFYISSLSARTVVYKGQLISHQIPKFFLEANQ